ENAKNDEVDSTTLRQNDNPNDPGTRLEPMSNKESPEVEITTEVQPVNINEDESPRIHSTLISSDIEELQQLTTRFMPRKKFNVLAQHLQEIMEESLPKMVDDRMQYNKNARINNDSKRQKTSEHGTYVFGESSSSQDNESEPSPSTSDDDEIRTKKVSQELVDEISQTIDEAKLRKVVNEMLRQRGTSGDEHQYHIDQMQNFLKNDIVWESSKEILVSPHPQKPTPVVQSCQRDPKAPALSLVNQDLLYLKKGSSRPEKIMMSLHKFPAVIFPDDDIKERTSRWVDKCVNKFNPYARYNVEHWKNPHAKIFYIKKQKEPGKPKEVVFSNSKIVQINKTYRELGHEHKFITEIVAIRANGNIVSITESDYKNLNKNDIEDMYTLIVNSKVDEYAETARYGKLSNKVNLTASTITFPSIEKYTVFSIVSEPMYGLIYKNSKKEKRVMRHQEVHKFCYVTLKRGLEGLKSYNNDVKHGYVTPSLSNEDVEYLQLFEEEVEERLKQRDQMRRWEIYVNGRPLGSRREHP
ncbi:hypothetical protein Tco_0663077, partial [Tanacetum coccineum]